MSVRNYLSYEPKTSNKFNNFNNTGVGILDSIYHMIVSDTKNYFVITFFCHGKC